MAPRAPAQAQISDGARLALGRVESGTDLLLVSEGRKLEGEKRSAVDLVRMSTNLSATQTCLDVSSWHLEQEREDHQAEQKPLLWLEEVLDARRAISTNTSRGPQLNRGAPVMRWTESGYADIPPRRPRRGALG